MAKPIQYRNFQYEVRLFMNEGWLVIRDSHGEELAWVNLDDIRKRFTDFDE